MISKLLSYTVQLSVVFKVLMKPNEKVALNSTWY